MNGIKTTTSALRDMAKNLYQQGICNSTPMGAKEWFEKRDGQDYTRIAYSQGKYGITSELYYMKGTKEFCYV